LDFHTTLQACQFSHLPSSLNDPICLRVRMERMVRSIPKILMEGARHARHHD
jgi:hypothetical protein